MKKFVKGSAMATELTRHIGKRGLWSPFRSAGDLRVAVEIIDATFAYGRIRLRVTPVTGEGEALVQASQVIVNGIETPSPVD